jgi:hypothetical protein
MHEDNAKGSDARYLISTLEAGGVGEGADLEANPFPLVFLQNFWAKAQQFLLWSPSGFTWCTLNKRPMPESHKDSHLVAGLQADFRTFHISQDDTNILSC